MSNKHKHKSESMETEAIEIVELSPSDLVQVETEIENESEVKRVKAPYIYAEGLTTEEHKIISLATKYEKSKVGKHTRFNALDFLRLAIEETTGRTLVSIIRDYEITHISELADYETNKGSSVSVKKQLISENDALRNALIAQGMSKEEIDNLVKG